MVKIVLGNNLRRLRETAKLTQVQLAALVNQTQAEISNYERGADEPRLSTLIQIARVLNATHLPLEWWFETHDTGDLGR